MCNWIKKMFIIFFLKILNEYMYGYWILDVEVEISWFELYVGLNK